MDADCPPEKQETGRTTALLNLLTVNELQGARVHWRRTGRQEGLKRSFSAERHVALVHNTKTPGETQQTSKSFSAALPKQPLLPTGSNSYL